MSMMSEIRRTLWRCRVPKVVILLYHRVSAPGEAPGPHGVSEVNFRGHVEELKKNWKVLALGEAVEALRACALEKRAVAVTFDDGYADNLRAAEILEQAGLPATFFVTAGMVGSKTGFWWDRLARIFDASSPVEEFFEIDVAGARVAIKRDQTGHAVLADMFRKLPVDSINRVIEALERKFPPSDDGEPLPLPLSEEELNKLAGLEGMEIGNHGLTHDAVGALDGEDLESQLGRSGEILAKVTGKKARFFAYPFGAPADFDDRAVASLRKLGYEAAFANNPEGARTEHDLFKLPRFVVRDWTPGEFAKKLDRFFMR